MRTYQIAADQTLAANAPDIPHRAARTYLRIQNVDAADDCYVGDQSVATTGQVLGRETAGAMRGTGGFITLEGPHAARPFWLYSSGAGVNTAVVNIMED